MGSDFKTEVLSDLGFSKNEIAAYLTLLDLGSATSWEIAKKAKLHRTNIYDAIDRLVKKGVVSYIDKGGKKYYEVLDPNLLVNIVKEKEFSLQKIIPELVLAKKMSGQESGACIFEGVQAFQKILMGWLRFEEPIIAYGIPKNAPEMMKYFMPHFHEVRIEKKIPMKHIYNHNAQERIKFLNNMSFTEAKFLPQQYHSTVSTNVCGNEVVLVLWLDTPLVIQIRNQQIADSYKSYFEVLWKGARSN
ncbi:helix-turn-helix domain-containing protein [Candidatus Woesearchaeota archaeon]|nr:helix-turn-helix domain-containing protein [Candidatus Woesearchaeota archaeon]